MSDPAGGPLATPIIDTVEVYEQGKQKISELGQLFDEIKIHHLLHLAALDYAIRVLKGGFPLDDRGKAFIKDDGKD